MIKPNHTRNKSCQNRPAIHSWSFCTKKRYRINNFVIVIHYEHCPDAMVLQTTTARRSVSVAAVVRWRHNAPGTSLRFPPIELPRIGQKCVIVWGSVRVCESGCIVIFILRSRVFLFVRTTRIIAPGSNNLLRGPPRACRYKIERKEITGYSFECGRRRRRIEEWKRRKKRKQTKK